MAWDIGVDVWKTESLSWDTVDRAEEAIENLADQLDTSANIYRRGVYSGNDNHNTYEDYLEEFKDVELHVKGRRSLLLYKRAFDPSGGGGGGFDKYPNLGASDEPYKIDAKGYTIVNGNILETSLAELASIIAPGALGKWFIDSHQMKIYKNIVKHEILHSMLDDANSPDTDTDHAFGQVDVSWWRNEISPMLTGYVVGPNDTPNPCCGGCSHGATDWKGTLSECTGTEAARWLEDEYYSGNAFAPCDLRNTVCSSN